MAAIDWTKKNLIPLNGLEAWHQYDPATSTDSNINDASGHARHVGTQLAGPPVLTSNVINGQPAWYFNGSSTPLIYSGGFPSIMHAFVVMAFEDAAFTNYQGVISGPTTGTLLVSDTTGDKFFDFALSTYQYRKAEVAYASNNQKAPMSSKFAALEVSVTNPSYAFGMDGIQIGQQITTSTRKLKGYFVESLLYSVPLNDFQRSQIYEYLAMRYHLWSENATGLKIFPFPSNKVRSKEYGRENFISEPYDGALKALVRGSFKNAYQLPYALRQQLEYQAAEAFFAEHYPIKDFVVRDYRYNPAAEITGRFASPIKEQGSDVTYRFNYSFDFVQTA